MDVLKGVQSMSATPDAERRPKPRTNRLLAFAAFAILAAALLDAWETPAFELYFGGIPPVLATALVVSLGFGSLVAIRSNPWFLIDSGRPLAPGLGRATAVALVLTVPVVVVDLMGGFGPGINVTVPRALLFYPLMAVVAECVFHLVPLAVVISLLRTSSRSLRPSTPTILISIVALLEPSFQFLGGFSQAPLWANLYVAAHVFVFNLLSLWFFRRYDLYTMYAFRLAYYAFWHVAWGYLRLPLLFG